MEMEMVELYKAQTSSVSSFFSSEKGEDFQAPAEMLHKDNKQNNS